MMSITDPEVASATIAFPITRGMVETTIQMAGFGIAYWADDLKVDHAARQARVTLAEEFEDELPDGRGVITYEEIGDAFAAVVENELCAQYIRNYARDTVIDQDAGNIDAELADVVIQIALFGKVVFA